MINHYTNQLGNFYLIPFHTHTPNSPLSIWHPMGNGACDKMTCVVGKGWQSRPGCYNSSPAERVHCPSWATWNYRTKKAHSDRPTHPSDVALRLPVSHSGSEGNSPSPSSRDWFVPSSSASDPVALPSGGGKVLAKVSWRPLLSPTTGLILQGVPVSRLPYLGPFGSRMFGESEGHTLSDNARRTKRTPPTSSRFYTHSNSTSYSTSFY